MYNLVQYIQTKKNEKKNRVTEKNKTQTQVNISNQRKKKNRQKNGNEIKK